MGVYNGGVGKYDESITFVPDHTVSYLNSQYSSW